MPPRKSSERPRNTPSSRPPLQPAIRDPSTPPEVVDPLWLLKALGVTAVVAVLCAWVALCLLYYQGSWQLVLHPSRTVDRTPASLNIPFEEIHFDAGETGQPRLTAWWMPAGPVAATAALPQAPRYAADTILYLHDGSGSLSSALPALALLHSAGISVFALDYRGFGQSEPSPHPTSESMNQDASAALNYLTGTRHLAPDHIVPYGTGLGASLAVALANNHGELPAVIVDNPDPDPTQTAIAAQHSGLVPVRWLYHEHFEISPTLSRLPTPKLLLSGGPNSPPSPARAPSIQQLFRSAASPAISVALPSAGYEAMYTQALTRFLDQYLPSASAPR